MNAAKREQIFRIWEQHNPKPSTELQYRNHFELLISIILSAQATDISVNKATPGLFAEASTPEAIIRLGIEKIKEHIKTIGLYNSKAKNILACCHILTEKHGSQIPETRKELEALPGVGVKTAGVFLNVGLNQPEIPVDTHVLRVSNRIGLVKTKNEGQTEKALQRHTPKWAKFKAHHWLILHGRYICKAKKPQCHICQIYEICEYKQKHPSSLKE